MKTTFTTTFIGSCTAVLTFVLLTVTAIAGNGVSNQNGEVVDIESKTDITIIDDSGVIHDIKNTDTNTTINLGDKVIYIEEENEDNAVMEKRVKSVVSGGHHH